MAQSDWPRAFSAHIPACGPTSDSKADAGRTRFHPGRYPGRRIFGRPPRARARWRVSRATASVRFTRTAMTSHGPIAPPVDTDGGAVIGARGMFWQNQKRENRPFSTVTQLHFTHRERRFREKNTVLGLRIPSCFHRTSHSETGGLMGYEQLVWTDFTESSD